MSYKRADNCFDTLEKKNLFLSAPIYLFVVVACGMRKKYTYFLKRERKHKAVQFHTPLQKKTAALPLPFQIRKKGAKLPLPLRNSEALLQSAALKGTYLPTSVKTQQDLNVLIRLKFTLTRVSR